MINLLIGLTIIGIMLAMGLELSAKDFRRIVEMPRAVLTGLVAQLALLPALAFAVAYALDTPPEIAVGMVILAACPGGPPSNVLSYLAGAHIAVSVTLTALSSLAAVVTVPVIVNLGLATFYDGPAHVRLPLLPTLAQLAALTLLPIGTGLYLQARYPANLERWRARIKRASLVLFGLAAIVIVYDSWDEFAEHFAVGAVASVVLCWCALALGYASASLARLDRRDRVTIALEVGVQNIALASLIIFTQLHRPELIPFPSTYAVISLPSAMLVAGVYAVREARRQAPSPATPSPIDSPAGTSRGR